MKKMLFCNSYWDCTDETNKLQKIETFAGIEGASELDRIVCATLKWRQRSSR